MSRPVKAAEWSLTRLEPPGEAYRLSLTPRKPSGVTFDLHIARGLRHGPRVLLAPGSLRVEGPPVGASRRRRIDLELIVDHQLPGAVSGRWIGRLGSAAVWLDGTVALVMWWTEGWLLAEARVSDVPLLLRTPRLQSAVKALYGLLDPGGRESLLEERVASYRTTILALRQGGYQDSAITARLVLTRLNRTGDDSQLRNDVGRWTAFRSKVLQGE